MKISFSYHAGRFFIPLFTISKKVKIYLLRHWKSTEIQTYRKNNILARLSPFIEAKTLNKKSDSDLSSSTRQFISLDEWGGGGREGTKLLFMARKEYKGPLITIHLHSIAGHQQGHNPGQNPSHKLRHNLSHNLDHKPGKIQVAIQITNQVKSKSQSRS